MPGTLQMSFYINVPKYKKINELFEFFNRKYQFFNGKYQLHIIMHHEKLNLYCVRHRLIKMTSVKARLRSKARNEKIYEDDER